MGRAQQINDFSKLLFGRITPTDIDGIIEYHNKAYIILEIKYRDKEMPYGQRLCLERMVQDFQANGKWAVAGVIEHDIDDITKTVPVGDCPVRELYYSNERIWREPKHLCTAYEMAKTFFDYVNSRDKTA